MKIDEDYLKHFGVLGMRWGSRRGKLVRKQTMLTSKRQKKLDEKELSKLENKKGFRSAHQKKIDTEKIKVLTSRLKDKKFEPMMKEDKVWFKKAAKVVGVSLAVVGSAKISSILAERAVNKYYANKIADSIIKMMENKQARSVINL